MVFELSLIFLNLLMVQKRALFKAEQNSNTFVCSIFVYPNILSNEEKLSVCFVFSVVSI